MDKWIKYETKTLVPDDWLVIYENCTLKTRIGNYHGNSKYIRIFWYMYQNWLVFETGECWEDMRFDAQREFFLKRSSN